MTILFDILLRVARELTPDVYESIATGGSATTLVDATANIEDDDWWIGGTLFYKSGILENYTATITDFTKSSGTFAFATFNGISNPSFETNANGHSAYGAGVTIARSTSQYCYGAASLEITPAANVSSGQTTTAACVAGVTYTVSVGILDVAAQTFSLQYHLPSGTYRNSTSWTGVGGAWIRKYITFTAAVTGTAQFFLVRDAVNSATTFYTDGWQMVVGSITSYAECAVPDTYLALSKSWRRAELVRAVNTVLGKQDIVADNIATSSVAAQYTYNLPTGVSHVLSVFVGTEADGWVRHFNWQEEGVHLRFTANEPDADTILIRYLTKHDTVTADSDSIDIGINVDLVVKDALAELWFQRWGGVDKNEASKIRYQTYAGEAERLRSRLPHHNPDPRYSGL
jgi:hypothetical protein